MSTLFNCSKLTPNHKYNWKISNNQNSAHLCVCIFQQTIVFLKTVNLRNMYFNLLFLSNGSFRQIWRHYSCSGNIFFLKKWWNLCNVAPIQLTLAIRILPKWYIKLRKAKILNKLIPCHCGFWEEVGATTNFYPGWSHLLQINITPVLTKLVPMLICEE